MPPKNIFDIYNKGMRARLTTPGLNYDNSIGGLPNYSIMPDNSFTNPSNTTLNNTTSNNTGDSNDVTGNNKLGIATAFVKGFDTLNDIAYNAETPLSDNRIYDVAMRGTAQDRHVANQLYDLFATGNGLWGESSREREIKDAVNYARNSGTDFSNMYSRDGSIDTLINAWNPNLIQGHVDVPKNTYDNTDAYVAANAINQAIDLANYGTISSFDNARDTMNQRNLRQNMMNYFDEGGDMGNGITMFNTGSSHEQNPYGGIMQGIASDGLPNLVEEGEVKYEDYIFSNRLKPSKTLIKDNLLPEKYFGLTYAELAKKLQKESEERPNDPISKQTLEDWMTRLTNAQETQKAKIEERRLAKAVDNMSDEEKIALLSSLGQSMAQQEGIDLNQPMFAEGGSIHIKPSKKGTFTAAAKKRGMGVQEFASKVLANPENYTEAMRKKAQFAHNAKSFKNADGGHLAKWGLQLDIPPYQETSSLYAGLEPIEPEEKDYISLQIPTNIYFPNMHKGETYENYIKRDRRYPYKRIISPEGKLVDDLSTLYSDVKYKLSPSEIRDDGEIGYFFNRGFKNFTNSANDEEYDRLFNAVSSLPEFKELADAPKNTNEFKQVLYDFAHGKQGLTYELMSLLNTLRLNDPTEYRTTYKPLPYDEPNMSNPIWRQGLFTNNLPKPTSVDSEQTEPNNSEGTVNENLLARRLGESFRYAQAVGAGIGALIAGLQPVDYSYPNELRSLASQYKPIGAPTIGGYRRYKPYDVNLGDVENLALQTAALNANRGQNRATQGALNTAVIAKSQEASAKRNLAAQQANEANRLAVDTYNLGIDQTNANLVQAYDQLNQQINNNRINMLARAAQEADSSRTAWSNMLNTTGTNFFNQLGNVGRDEWNRNQFMLWLAQHPASAKAMGIEV